MANKIYMVILTAVIAFCAVGALFISYQAYQLDLMQHILNTNAVPVSESQK